jgi:hypothetical protein
MNRLAWAFLAACLVLGAAQTIQLSQIVSKPYPGVMVNTGSGWVQAAMDSTLVILVSGPGQYILHATGGGSSTPIPPPLPITVTPDGGIAVKSLSTTGTGASKVILVKPDGTSCTLAVGAAGNVTCQ